jgi:predicted outer membrane repeat protein
MTFVVTTALDMVNPTDGKLSLREAITQANSTAGPDTVVLPAGMFKITTTGADEDGNLTGDFDITDSVTIRGAGAGLTFVDGKQLDRVFDVLGTSPSSIQVTLQGLTVRNGKVTGDGGGIRVGFADLIVQSSAFFGNQAALTGGGISNASAPGTGIVILRQTTVGRNVAGSTGGGVEVVGGSLLGIDRGRVLRNVAIDGGGIFADAVTLTDSIVLGNTATNDGGGVHATSATLNHSTLRGNHAGASGGGIWAVSATITDSTIVANHADQGGAGIDASALTLTGSTVSRNSASLNGGGILGGAATLTNSTLSNNTSNTFGGGMWVNTVSLDRSSILKNIAGQNGGGIVANAVGLTDSTVSGNRAMSGFGGGLVAVSVTGTNVTVCGNTAATSGGGIAATAGSLLNCTVAGNSAGTDSGGIFQKALFGSTIAIRNTIIARNTVGSSGTGPDVAGTFASLGHNLIGDGTGGGGFTADDLVGTSAKPINPRLGALRNNGGPTKTMALLAGSPAIDAGDDANTPATDQRGHARKKDGNGDGVALVDIGAFER